MYIYIYKCVCIYTHIYIHVCTTPFLVLYNKFPKQANHPPQHRPAHPEQVQVPIEKQMPVPGRPTVSSSSASSTSSGRDWVHQDICMREIRVSCMMQHPLVWVQKNVCIVFTIAFLDAHNNKHEY